jgi:hypothetical protein
MVQLSKTKKLLAMLCSLIISTGTQEANAAVFRVPEEVTSIQMAINTAKEGDTILIAPGTYNESISLSKALTIASRYIHDGAESHITGTVIDGQTKTVFNITGPAHKASTIIGITIQNGDDGIMANSPFNIFHCIVTACNDGIDYETGSGGQCIHNTFKDNLDDAIDLDGTLSDVLIQDNIIENNDDDGIEIRLHTYQGETRYCRIISNTIRGNGEDGIQFIDYADTSNRVYLVEKNLILDNEMAGVGLMDDGITQEDFRGAPIPEPIYLFNNTISGAQYGITGGARLIAVNNIVQNCIESGIINLTGKSHLSHTLFFGNGEDMEGFDISPEVNYFEDPFLNQNQVPMAGSPCIDRGLSLFVIDTDTLLRLDASQYYGSAPDLGAKEYSGVTGHDLQHNDPALSVWPNPFSDYLMVEREQNPGILSRYRILDLQGRLILEHKSGGSRDLIETAHIPAGIYLFSHTGSNVPKSMQIIKL